MYIETAASLYGSLRWRKYAQFCKTSFVELFRAEKQRNAFPVECDG